MLRVLPVLLLLFVLVYSVVDVLNTEDDRARLGLGKGVWVALIVLTAGGAGLVWLLVKFLIRPGRDDSSGRPAGPVAPDDDPDFLFKLRRDLQRRKKDGGGKPGSDTSG